MKKFTKLFENKESIIQVLDITEDEIRDICQDLIDEFEYDLDINYEWMSTKTGTRFSTPNQAIESYPIMTIELKRNVDDKKDPRNWNGGIYYENDDNIIKRIYEVIYRIKSLCNEEGVKIFYSTRSINQIEIRISTPIEKSKVSFNKEKIYNFIKNISDINLYEYQARTSNDWKAIGKIENEIKVIISTLKKSFDNNYKKYSDESIDSLVFRKVFNGETNNLSDFGKISEIFAFEMLDVCREDAKTAQIVEYYTNSDGSTDFFIKDGDHTFLKVEFKNEKLQTIDVTIPNKNGFWNSTKNVKFDLYVLYANVKFLI
jgi:hypothetical protein